MIDSFGWHSHDTETLSVVKVRSCEWEWIGETDYQVQEKHSAGHASKHLKTIQF